MDRTVTNEEQSSTALSQLSFSANLFKSDPGQKKEQEILIGLEPKNPGFAPDIVLRTILTEVVSTLSDPALRQKYSDPKITERELLNVVKECGTANRMLIASLLFEANTYKVDFDHKISGKIHDFLKLVPLNERIELLSELIGGGTRATRSDNLRLVLSSAENGAELLKIVETVGVSKIFQAGNHFVKELVAQAVLNEGLRDLSLPRQTTSKAGPERLKEAVAEVERALEERLQKLSFLAENEHPELQTTKTHHRYLDIAISNVEYFEREKTRCRNLKQLRELVNTMGLKIELEFQYGIKLSHEDPSFRSPGAKWSSAELAEVKKAFDKIGEGVLLTTPNLTEIQRVHSIGEHILGVRLPNGVIGISDLGVDHKTAAKKYPGVSSLELTLVHEMGHGIQLGRDFGGLVKHPSKGILFSNGEPDFDFKKYMDLSGWTIIQPDHWQFSKDLDLVIIDGDEYPLGRPVFVNGKPVTLHFIRGDEGSFLYAHDTFAGFSSDNYSMTNPWEDWAEGFTEYILSPKSLVKFAPDKFEYFETKFRHYAEDRALMALLEESREKRQKIQSLVFATGSGGLREAA